MRRKRRGTDPEEIRPPPCTRESLPKGVNSYFFQGFQFVDEEGYVSTILKDTPMLRSNDLNVVSLNDLHGITQAFFGRHDFLVKGQDIGQGAVGLSTCAVVVILAGKACVIQLSEEVPPARKATKKITAEESLCF